MLRVITELIIMYIADRGVPNKERIYLKTTVDLSLGSYLLSLGYPVGNQKVYPGIDQYFWFGNETVAADTWIIVYTGPGEPKISKMNDERKDPVLVLHWGKPQTMLGDTRLFPYLLSVDGVLVAESEELQKLIAATPDRPTTQQK
jgi:hypothetical protein